MVHPYDEWGLGALQPMPPLLLKEGDNNRITTKEHVRPQRNVNTEIAETRDEYKHRPRMEMLNK